MNNHLQYFLSEKTSIISYNHFNHCPTILSDGNTIITAWYAGAHECSKDQKVLLKPNDQDESIIELEEGTGNPVLFKDADDRIFLLYSKFVHHDTIRTNVDKWKFCELRIREYNKNETGTGTLSEYTIISSENEHLLGRCTAVIHDKMTYLPLYDELNAKCIIFRGNGLSYEKHIEFGDKEIQPALYKNNVGLRALTRNFFSNKTYSTMHCLESGNSVTTNIPNHNSSLACLKYGNNILCIYNNSNTHFRTNLTLGFCDGSRISPLIEIDKYGSYPSIIEHQKGIAIAYTTFHKTIASKWFEGNQLFARAAYSSNLEGRESPIL